jgi:SOS-response transcriptional repressor LexA
MDDMASRLKKLRSDKKISQRELSRITNIEQATISRIERGEMSLLSPHVPTLSRALGVPPAKLLGYTVVTTPAQVGSRRIPVLSFDQAGRLANLAALPEDVEMKDSVLVDLPHSANAFALRIQGDSMEHVFAEGDVVVIDPDVDVQPGDFVFAVVESEGPTFRRYRDVGMNDDGNRVFELDPLNKLFAAFRSDRQTITIKGVMVEHRKYRRKK